MKFDSLLNTSLACCVALSMVACSKSPPPATATAESQEAQDVAGPDPLIERARLFGNPDRTQARLSPDGAHVSFIAPLDGVLNVWVAPRGDLKAARPLTRVTGRGIRQHLWAEDNAHVLYFRDTGGDENFHLYSVALTDGESHDLTPFENTQAQLIATSHDRPDEVLVALNNRDPRLHDPYRLHLSTGKLERLEQNEGFLAYVADNRLELRLALRQTADGGFAVKRHAARGWVAFENVPPQDTQTTQLLGFDGSNAGVYMLDSRGRDTAALVRVALEDDAKTVVMEDPRADVTALLVDPVTHEPLAAAANYERLTWRAIDAAVAGDLERLTAALGQDWAFLSSTSDGARWIVADNRADAPLTYYLYDRGSHALDELFVTRPDLIGQPLAGMTSEVISARDGLPLVAYLTLPRWTDPDGDGRPATALPMMLWVHGGPWARDEFGFNSYHQWFANRGYAVLSVNYRGSTGFGKAFVNAGNLEWAGKMHADLIDAVDWAVKAGVTTADRVAIGGGSYGGYATLVGLTFTPDRFSCGVDIVGPSNLATLLATIPPYWEPILNVFASRIGDPRTDAGRRLLAERSPLTRASAIERPLLIGQGANDPRVKQAESDQIVAAMRSKKLPVTYVLFPDEGHGFGRPENSLAFNAIAENFLTTCLGGRAEPIGQALVGSSTTVPGGAEYVPGLEAALAGFEPAVRK